MSPSGEARQTPLANAQSMNRCLEDSGSLPQKVHRGSTLRCLLQRLVPICMMSNKILHAAILALGGILPSTIYFGNPKTHDYQSMRTSTMKGEWSNLGPRDMHCWHKICLFFYHSTRLADQRLSAYSKEAYDSGRPLSRRESRIVGPSSMVPHRWYSH